MVLNISPGMEPTWKTWWWMGSMWSQSIILLKRLMLPYNAHVIAISYLFKRFPALGSTVSGLFLPLIPSSLILLSRYVIQIIVTKSLNMGPIFTFEWIVFFWIFSKCHFAPTFYLGRKAFCKSWIGWNDLIGASWPSSTGKNYPSKSRSQDWNSSQYTNPRGFLRSTLVRL